MNRNMIKITVALGSQAALMLQQAGDKQEWITMLGSEWLVAGVTHGDSEATYELMRKLT